MSHHSLSTSGLDFINLEVITEIQKDIDPSDMISLMFLLYEDPQTALRNLQVYERVSADIGVGDSSLLHDWVAQAHTRNTWKQDLLEALFTCQLHAVIRKLGFHKQTLLTIFEKDIEYGNHVNSMRKIFYRVCENMDNTSYKRFKQIICSNYVNIPDYETCEMVFLELMCRKFFSPVMTMNVFDFNDINKLLQILNNIPACKKVCSEIRAISNINTTLEISRPATPQPALSSTLKELPTKVNEDKVYAGDLSKEFQQLESAFENLSLEVLKTDDKGFEQDLGLCYIINQEIFSTDLLKNRPESAADKAILTKTMKDHHISVISNDNLSGEEIINSIKNVIKNLIKKHHNVFFLCILSHGYRDHIYSANGEDINILDIENLLDSNSAIHLRTIPKVVILQACQSKEKIVLETDSPEYYIKKSNMVTFCSTAPGYKAYRKTGDASIFIPRLCEIIQKHSHEEHLTDMFTKVTENVYNYCTWLKVDQLPTILRNTLTTKIYLKKRSTKIEKPREIVLATVI